MPGAGEQQPGQPGMGRQPEQVVPERRDPVAALRPRLDRAEVSEQVAGVGEGFRRGRIEPGKVAVFAEREELQQRPGQVAADCFRRLGGRAVLVRGSAGPAPNRSLPSPPGS